jgi:hypothetical protein
MPSKVAEHEAAVKELIAQFTEQKVAIPQIEAFMRDDFHYYYVMPTENFAAVDALNKTMEEFDKKLGEAKSSIRVLQVPTRIMRCSRRA